jgi:Ca2+-binding EF-hand superfamily protein
MMEEADTNNDGEIDLDEFIAYMLRTTGIDTIS